MSLPQLHSLFAQVPRTPLTNSGDDLLYLHPHTKRALLEEFEKSVVSKPWNRTFLSNNMPLSLCTWGPGKKGWHPLPTSLRTAAWLKPGTLSGAPFGPAESSTGSAPLPGSQLQFLSGFTAMTEKFSTAMYMDRGAEQLVEILNYYISAIVESKCPRGSHL